MSFVVPVVLLCLNVFAATPQRAAKPRARQTPETAVAEAVPDDQLRRLDVDDGRRPRRRQPPGPAPATAPVPDGFLRCPPEPGVGGRGRRSV